jgi:hypothetical protein
VSREFTRFFRNLLPNLISFEGTDAFAIHKYRPRSGKATYFHFRFTIFDVVFSNQPASGGLLGSQMKLLVLQDVAFNNLDGRFRHSPLADLITLLVFFSLVAGAICWYWFGDLPLYAVILFGGFMLIMGRMAFFNFRKSLAPTNWLLAIGPDRILIKFRSFLNSHFPSADPQVVSLDPSEIASARITTQWIKAPGLHSRRQTSFHTFLDLHVPSVDLAPLKERVKYERTLKAQKIGKHVSLKVRHYPVSVMGEDTIRIEWPSPLIYFAPGIKKALAALDRQGIRLESPKKEKIDLTRKGRSDLKSAEDKILYLAERGNFPAAVKLARRTYRLSLTEAKQFVEGLME